MLFVNIIKSYRHVVAICDSELLGKYFEEDNLQLDVKKSFYKGEEVSEDQVEKIIQDMSIEDATFNIVGNKAVKLAVKMNLIEPNSVKEISGVKYAMVLL